MEQRHIVWFRTYVSEADRRLMERDGHGRFDEEAANLEGRDLDRAAGYDPDSSVSIVASLTRHWILAERFEEALNSDSSGACGRRRRGNSVATCGGSLRNRGDWNAE